MRKISFRSLLFFIKLSILVFLVFMLMQYPGEIQISWFGYRLKMAPVVFLVGMCLGTTFLILLISLWRYIWGLPVFWTQWCRANRLKKSKIALLEGLTAFLSGELDQAESLASKAISLNPKNPLNYLLLAQTAYSLKNYEICEKVFLDLSQKPETAFIGLKGLFQIAAIKQDFNQMRQLLRQALAVQPSSPWVLHHLFQLDLKASSFDQAERIMEQLGLLQEISPEQYAHQLGLVHWLRAKQLKVSGDQNGFLKYAQKAFHSAPELTELAVSLSEDYRNSGQDSKAKRLIKEAFEAAPHPDLEPIWDSLHSEKTDLERYKEAETLTATIPNHPESLFVLTKAAIRAKLWGQARYHLKELMKTKEILRTYSLMAELEEAENSGNPRLVQDLLQKAVSASPASSWRCSSCCASSKSWQAFCTTCHEFDTVTWGMGAADLKKDFERDLFYLP